MILATLGAHYVLLASPGPAPVQRMAALVAQARTGDEPYGRHRVFDRNLVYYTRSPYVELATLGAAQEFLQAPERVLSVLLEEDAALLERDGLPLRRLGSVSFLNTGGLTLRALIDPESPTGIDRGGPCREPLARTGISGRSPERVFRGKSCPG